MFIVPFIHNKISQSEFDIISIKIFTMGGNNLWEESDKLNLDKDILNPNGMFKKGTTLVIGKKIKYCEIDTTKTNINEFYNWEEIELNEADTFCWRNFCILVDKNGKNWLEIPDSEMLGNYKIKDIINTIILKKLKK